jgi:TolB protein
MLLQKIHNKTIFFQTSRVVRLLMFFFLIYKNNPLIAQEIYVFGSVKKKNLSIDYNKNTYSKKELFVLNNIKQIIENNITNAISLKNIDLQNIINKNCAIKENELEQIESEAIIHNEDGQNNSTEECIENFNTLRFNQKLNIVHDDIDYLIHLEVKFNNEQYNIKYELWSNSIYPSLSNAYTFSLDELRYTSHIISNEIVTHLSGYNPYFESKIMYIKNSPSGNRYITISDRDGSGERVVKTEPDAYSPIYIKSLNKIVYVNMTKGYPKMMLMDFGDWMPYKIHKTFYENFRRVVSIRSYNSEELLFMHMADDDDSSMNLIKMNLKTMVAQRVFKTSDIALSPIKTSNGTIFYQKAAQNNKQQIYKITNSLFLGQVHSLVTKDINSSYFDISISPNEQWIAFVKKKDGKYHIGVIDVNGENEKILFSANEVLKPSWNQNSVEIAFSFEDKKDKCNSIGIIDIAGNFVKKIQCKDEDLLEPFWFNPT